MQPKSEFLTRTPVYIIGLEAKDPETSLAEGKFKRSIGSLSRIYPDIAEARAKVKSFSKFNERRHFEVHVMIGLPKQSVEFVEEGWTIEEVFENIGRKIKRLRTKPRDSPARRLHPRRAEIAVARY